jgi:hypothetical protein
MAETSKPIVRFNIQNCKYAFGDSASDVKPFGTAVSIDLQSTFSTKPLYGDGLIQLMLANDKGKSGTLRLNMVPDDYEIAVGRKLTTTNGVADIKQTAIVPHHIYFEVKQLKEDAEDGQADEEVVKVWLYNVTTTRPNESYQQSDDDSHETVWELPLTILGTPVMQEQKTGDPKPYIVNGIEVKAWQMVSVPTDTGYDTFGEQVVYPVVAQAQAS